MSKPVVFFSHSSADKEPLRRLKETFRAKTGGSVEVFVSSDGQSIPFGKNWVHAVEQALDRCKVMFVFVTPASLHSKWLYFEAGYAYAKGIRVVTVGFLGVDLAALEPPLAFLQGFNVSSAAGLNNLLVTINREFEHAHPESFTQDDFRQVVGGAASGSASAFGKYASTIDEITIFADVVPAEVAAEKVTVKTILEETADALITTGLRRVSSFFQAPGVAIPVQSTSDLEIAVEASVAKAAFPLAIEVLTLLREKVTAPRTRILFERRIRCELRPHKLSALLAAVQADLVSGRDEKLNAFVWRGIKFRIFLQDVTFGGPPPLHPIVMVYGEHALKLEDLASLVAMLFEARVIFPAG